MVRGIGTDIIEISRIRNSIARHGSHFLNKIYTQAEQEYCLAYNDAAPHFAARFAAKEAISKAIGTGIRDQVSWLEIEVRNQKNGQPHPILSKELDAFLQHPRFLLSISHCREYAVATAILL